MEQNKSKKVEDNQAPAVIGDDYHGESKKWYETMTFHREKTPPNLDKNETNLSGALENSSETKEMIYFTDAIVEKSESKNPLEKELKKIFEDYPDPFERSIALQKLYQDSFSPFVPPGPLSSTENIIDYSNMVLNPSEIISNIEKIKKIHNPQIDKKNSPDIK